MVYNYIYFLADFFIQLLYQVSYSNHFSTYLILSCFLVFTRTMPDYLKSLLAFLHGRFKAFIHGSGKCKSTVRKRKKILSSSFDMLTSSFTPLEVSNQFKTVFKLIDSNGDGKISVYELSQVLSCLGYDKSKAASEAEGMVKEIDCNGDGFIDFDEFFDAVHVGDGENNCGEEDDLMDAFLIFDVDKNGLISASELQRVLANLGCDNCSLQHCKRMIKSVDKDGDGFVDFEEFRAMMKPTSK